MKYYIFLLLSFFSLSGFAIDMPPGTVLVAYGNFPSMLTLVAYTLDPNTPTPTHTGTATPLFNPQQVGVFYDHPVAIQVDDGTPAVMVIHQHTQWGPTIDGFLANPGSAPPQFSVPNIRATVLRALNRRTVYVIGEHNEVSILQLEKDPLYKNTNGGIRCVVLTLAPSNWLDAKYGKIIQLSPIGVDEIYAITKTHLLHVNLAVSGHPRLLSAPVSFESLHGFQLPNAKGHTHYELRSVIADTTNVWVLGLNARGDLIFIHADRNGHHKDNLVIGASNTSSLPVIEDIDPADESLIYTYNGSWYRLSHAHGGINRTQISSAHDVGQADLKTLYGIDVPPFIHYEHARAVYASGRPTIFGGTSASALSSQLFQSSTTAGEAPQVSTPSAPPARPLPVTATNFLQELQNPRDGITAMPANPTTQDLADFINRHQINGHRILLEICRDITRLTDLKSKVGINIISGQIEPMDRLARVQPPVTVAMLSAFASILADTAADPSCQARLRSITNSTASTP